MRRTALLASTMLVALAVAPVGLAQPLYADGNRPVILSGGEGLDPCAYGMIKDEPTGPDTGAVMVFPGDSTDLDFADTLVHGDPVWVCEASENWLGIVYSRNPDLDCELSSPVAEDRPYVGPCDWGWVKAEWVEIVAG